MPGLLGDEFNRVVDVIAAAVDVARQTPEAGKPEPAADYVAWIVVNQLRLAGFEIVAAGPASGDNSNGGPSGA